MKDNYPTRKYDTGKFIPRLEAVSNTCEYPEYTRHGYLHIKNFFTEAEIKPLLNAQASGLVTKEPKLNATRSITGIHVNEPFRSLAKNERLLSIVKDILGQSIYIHQSRINYKNSIGANGWYWHSDFETWHAQDGMPGMRCLTVMVPITSNTEINGPLMVIAGSHKKFYSCRKEKTVSAQENFADQKEGVPDQEAMMNFFNEGQVKVIKCEPSDIVLFDCNIIHGSVQNMTPYPRTNLFFVYNTIENALQAPFSVDIPRPEEMGSRKLMETL